MIDPLPRRHHFKRCNRLTETMKGAWLKDGKNSQERNIIDIMMQELKSAPNMNSKKLILEAKSAKRQAQTTKNKKISDPLVNLSQKKRLPVDHGFRGIFKSSRQGLNRVLSADKVNLKSSTSGLERRAKQQNQGQHGKLPLMLSKKSTGESTQSEQQILREENQRFRELCKAEAERLLKLQKQIQNENKMQLIRRQLYQQSIKKLRRVAGEQLFLSQISDCDPQSVQESYEECDCLSVTSH